ncbi:hypothetical protein [Oscillatoria sp. FACHB-1406]|uniref:hypothetical protein n=1 Tax=Oscillatoria sp. FACHB-1406 TaxID=2692846 RepID=UPI001687CC6C|nr:hypothetical protein [Oscillatoria sp. FACHB-1406]MBD2576725.1 hypothetical protein [Oscillatoria sp. FACHB-1406]
MLAQPCIALNSPELGKMLPKMVMQLNATEQQDANPTNPPIANSLQREQYIGIGVLVILIILAIGLFSRKLEYAIVFSLILSLGFMAFGFLF